MTIGVQHERKRRIRPMHLARRRLQQMKWRCSEDVDRQGRLRRMPLLHGRKPDRSSQCFARSLAGLRYTAVGHLLEQLSAEGLLWWEKGRSRCETSPTRFAIRAPNGLTRHEGAFGEGTRTCVAVSTGARPFAGCDIRLASRLCFIHPDAAWGLVLSRQPIQQLLSQDNGVYGGSISPKSEDELDKRSPLPRLAVALNISFSAVCVNHDRLDSTLLGCEIPSRLRLHDMIHICLKRWLRCWR